MENHWLSRTEILIGKENIIKLQNAKVTIFGLGGVGSSAVEGLVRAGIGSFQLIDHDIINHTDLNRQIIALHSTIGQKKTFATQKRIMDINPEAKIEVFPEFINKNNRGNILQNTHYVIDAIDSIGPKMGLIRELTMHKIPFISVLGAGNHLHLESIKTTSIWETRNCPLAKRLKKLLRRYGVYESFPVVYSEDPPIKPLISGSTKQQEQIFQPKSIVGSISYLPEMMGLQASAYIIQLIIKQEVTINGHQKV